MEDRKFTIWIEKGGYITRTDVGLDEGTEEILIPEGSGSALIEAASLPFLRSISIPASLMELKLKLYEAPLLEKIHVESRNPRYRSDERGTVLIDNRSGNLMLVTRHCRQIPSSFSQIDVHAFSGRYQEKKLFLPSSNPHFVIKRGTFANTAIEEIHFSDGDYRLDAGAFDGSKILDAYIAPKTFFSFELSGPARERDVRPSIRFHYEDGQKRNEFYLIEDGCLVKRENGTVIFGRLDDKGNAVIPPSARIIGRNAYRGFSAKLIEIPTGIKEIRAAFSGYGKPRIVIPATVMKIKKTAFVFPEFADVEIDAGNPFYLSPKGSNCILTTQGRSLIVGTSNSLVPEGTRTIAESAFFFHSPEDLVLPSTLIAVCRNAFEWCKNLKKVTLPKYQLRGSPSAFRRCPNLKTIVVPKTCRIDERLLERLLEEDNPSIDGVVFEEGGIYFQKTADGGTMTSDGILLKAGRDGLVPSGTWAIAERAFYGRRDIKRVDFPASLKEIRSEAFMKSGLTAFKAPPNLRTIGDCAFFRCDDLMSIELNDGLEEIGLGAFYPDMKTESVDIPYSVRKIGEKALPLVSAKKIGIDADNLVYRKASEGNLIIDVSTMTVIVGDGCPEIPSGIKRIGNSAFFGSSGEGTICLPKGIDAIGNFAFAGCRYREIVCPDTVETIGSHAFFNCTSLESLRLPKELRIVNGGLFKDTPKLRKINVSAFLATSFIGAEAFMDSGINEIAMPKATFIGDRAFMNSRLSKAILPKKTLTLGKELFLGCRNLKEVQVGKLPDIPWDCFPSTTKLIKET